MQTGGRANVLGRSRSIRQKTGDLVNLSRNALTLNRSQVVFDLDSDLDKLQLAKELWKPSHLLGEDSLTAANPSLTSVFEILTRNTYRPADGDAHDRRSAVRIEALFAMLQRCQSRKTAPLLTVRLTLVAVRAQLPQLVWRTCFLCWLRVYSQVGHGFKISFR